MQSLKICLRLQNALKMNACAINYKSFKNIITKLVVFVMLLMKFSVCMSQKNKEKWLTKFTNLSRMSSSQEQQKTLKFESKFVLSCGISS